MDKLVCENGAEIKNLNLNDDVVPDDAIVDGNKEGEVCSNMHTKMSLPRGYAETMTSMDSSTYYMNHKRRGHCLIFNHHAFDKSTNLPERSGTNRDRDGIRTLFEMLGFDVNIFNNFSVKCIQDKLEYFAHDVDHSDCDCFVLVFMSHGEDGQLYGRDNIFKPEKLYYPFTADSCPSLAGKPKMFFIQACRGEGLDGGVTMVRKTMDETDSGSLSLYKIPAHVDFLICWSTIPGHYSWRNTTNGSWFIQSMIRVFSTDAATTDVLSMMTNVNRHMILNFESNCPSAPNMHRKKQSACIVTTLMRKVYITPHRC